ncbi:MAG: FAD-dependent oxidoreductase [Clostridiales bacterium]|nr:FAD-dependent oxidoreductase [Clostridiales bacterium]
MKKRIAIFIAVLLVIGSFGCSVAQDPAGEAEAPAAQTPSAEAIPSSRLFEPGTYTGSAMGRNGDVTVEVIVTEEEIVDVKIVSQNETIGVTDAALEQVPGRIVEKQSVRVDSLSGATVTSYAIMDAVKDAVSDYCADMDKISAPALREKSDAVVEKEAELVVVGAGASGMSTAVSFAQASGKSVVVLETQSTIGGNAIVSGGFLEYMDAPEALRPPTNEGYAAELESLLALDTGDNALMSEWQKKVKEDYAAYLKSGADYVFDSKELLAMQYHLLMLGRPDDSLIGYATKSGEVCRWFEEMGAEFQQLQIIIGFPWPRWSTVKGGIMGVGYFKALENEMAQKKLPIEIMTETSAVSLIEEGGKVVGVTAKGVDGTTYTVRAKRGVVLATGGFSANGKMLAQYNTQWESLDETIKSTNTKAQVGSGILMAQELGAGVALMDQYMLFPIANPKDGSLSGGINPNGALLVNKEGKRFVDETRSRNDMSNAILNQPGGMAYSIADANNSGVVDGMAGGYPVGDLIEKGTVIAGDTLEELAGKMGVDAATLKNTVEAFNAAVTSHTDAEFGRSVFNGTEILTEGPFYASPCAPSVHITLGGLLFDQNCNVITGQGQPIEGLYAVGEVTVGGAALSSFADGMALGRALGQ